MRYIPSDIASLIGNILLAIMTALAVRSLVVVAETWSNLADTGAFVRNDALNERLQSGRVQESK
jgi:predicted cobalt transporter CbtA